MAKHANNSRSWPKLCKLTPRAAFFSDHFVLSALTKGNNDSNINTILLTAVKYL